MLPLTVAVGCLLVLAALIFVALRQAAGVVKEDGETYDANEISERTNRMRAGLRRRRAGGRRRGQDEEEDPGQQEEQTEEQKFSRRDAYEARRAARDAEREAQEAAQEAEILKAAQERELREQEEADKWMHMFSVEGVGEDAMNKEDGEKVLTKVELYLKAKKMVPLEDVAAEVGVRTSDVVEMIHRLEKEQRVTGIMDDRGKYIYISDIEMKSVANFIKKEGRITIADLAKQSSSLIDLEPQPADTSAIEIDLDDLVQVQS